MEDLIEIAKKVAHKLINENQTISVIESSSGGLISQALLSQPGT